MKRPVAPTNYIYENLGLTPFWRTVRVAMSNLIVAALLVGALAAVCGLKSYQKAVTVRSSSAALAVRADLEQQSELQRSIAPTYCIAGLVKFLEPGLSCRSASSVRLCAVSGMQALDRRACNCTHASPFHADAA